MNRNSLLDFYREIVNSEKSFGIDYKNLSKQLIERIDKATEYIKHSQNYGTMAQVMPHLKPYVNGDDLLKILGDK